MPGQQPARFFGQLGRYAQIDRSLTPAVAEDHAEVGAKTAVSASSPGADDGPLRGRKCRMSRQLRHYAPQPGGVELVIKSPILHSRAPPGGFGVQVLGRGLSQFLRRDDRSHAERRFRRENGTVPLAAFSCRRSGSSPWNFRPGTFRATFVQRTTESAHHKKYAPILRWSAKVTATCTAVSYWPATPCAVAPRRRLHPLGEGKWTASSLEP